MKINELAEDGRIVKGVNTTPDVQPGETERQAKKLFPMNKSGKPQSLGVAGASPNVAFNLGLVESEDKKDILKGMDPKTVKAINNLMIKFPHAKDPITAIIADIEDSQAISIKNDNSNELRDKALTMKVDQLEKRLSDLEKDSNPIGSTPSKFGVTEDDELTTVQRAEMFAQQAHKDHKRKYTGDPYYVHLDEVRRIVKGAGGNEDMQAAALLHDTVEDTSVTSADIIKEFGPRIAKLVVELTDVSKPEDGNRAVRKGIDRDKLAGVSAEAQTIKYADLISNGKDIMQNDPKFAKVYMKEKADLLRVMTKGNSNLRSAALAMLPDELKENMSVTGTARRRLEKKKGLEIGSPEWFKHWFDLPYLREAEVNTTNPNTGVQTTVNKKANRITTRSDAGTVVKDRSGRVRSISTPQVGGFQATQTFRPDSTPGYQQATQNNTGITTTVKGSPETGYTKSNSASMAGFSVGNKNRYDGSKQKTARATMGNKQVINKVLNMSEGIQKVDVAQLEKFADRLFGKVGIDVEFTRHFMDRVNDVRNQKPITMSELTRLFKQEYKRWGKPIAQMGPNSQAVMKDLQTNINLPFVLQWDDKNNELDLIAKTVMRKQDFKTPNKEFPVEDTDVNEALSMNSLKTTIADIANGLGIDTSTAMALAQQESGFRQNVVGDQNRKNKAYGLFQVRKPALQDVNRLYKTNYTMDDLEDPKINTEVGLRYYQAQKDFYGAKNDAQAFRGYNGGPGAIKGKNKSANQYSQSVQATKKSFEKEYKDVNPPRYYDTIDNPQTITTTTRPTNQVPSPIIRQKVNYSQLAKASNIADPNKIFPGQTINLPGGSTYTVKSGDTLGKIAQNYNKGIIGENVPTTNKPGSIGQHINWGGKNAPDKPKSNISVARRKSTQDPQSWWQNVLQKGRNLFDDEQLELKKKFEITDELKKLANIFNRGGHEIRIVGGAVRDLALGKSPKDIDLATDATPQEMQSMFDSAGIRHIPTGIEHGTITAVVNGEEFEVTTLRADVETDGRRAEVEFVRSWEEDAKRRDLTYNAMSMDFEGNLYDYHGGMDDLQDKVTKFVGDPEERIKEDYLRTLRYFRFQGRLDTPTFDRETMSAIANNTDGLKQLSVERVWMEMGKILGGGNIQQILNAMNKAGVLNAIGLSYTPNNELMDGGDPIINLARITDDESIGPRWKMSNEEKGKLGFLLSQKGQTHDKKWYTDQMADGFDRTQLDALARYNNQDDMIAYIKSFKAPEFPVDGNDLIKLGHERGPKIGQTLNALRAQWKAGNFSASKDELLKTMNEDQEFNELDYVLKKEVKPSEAVMLTKLGKFHNGADELEQFVPERKGKQYALHPDNWKGTYYSLTNRDTKKIAYYRPKIVTPPAGSIVADMYIANQFYRTNDEDEKKKLAQAYKDSMVEYGADISHIKFPEILMPGVNEEGPFGVIARKASHLIHKPQYIKAAEMLHKILKRKYQETGGKLRHTLGYYAQMIANQTGNKINWRELQAEYLDQFGNAMFENFADGKKPGRKGLSKRVGIPKKATIAQLEKIAKNSTGERRRMAQWQLNMRRGKNKSK